MVVQHRWVSPEVDLCWLLEWLLLDRAGGSLPPGAFHCISEAHQRSRPRRSRSLVISALDSPQVAESSRTSDQERRLRRRWPGVSAPGSALGGPPGRTPGRITQNSQIKAAHTASEPIQRGASSSLLIVQLVVTASRAALRAVACDGFATLDAAPTHKGSAPARKNGAG
jgi:hypothetical protein